MFDVAFPIESWGTEYVLVKTGLDLKNSYRVVANTAGTNVYEDGDLVATLAAPGDSYDAYFTEPVIVVSTDGLYSFIALFR